MGSPTELQQATAKSDELIDVLRIRLSTPACATALMSEFWRADRVLANWAAQADCKQVNFEVMFCDGFVVRGSYAHFKNGKRSRPFSSHVRSMLKLATPASGGEQPLVQPALSRYLVPMF